MAGYETFLQPQPPCAQQTHLQHTYSSTISNNSIFYNNYDYSYTRANQQPLCLDQFDTFTTNWMSDIEKRLKFCDKIEAIEITSKDLSPASCCSNVDSVIQTPYYYNYPSCSVVDNNFSQQCEYSNIEPEQFYSRPLVDINQATECSGESDIIVEDSEECFSDNSQDAAPFLLSNCAICNVPYTLLGNQFYTLTNKAPLTMSSQRPVILKLQEMLRIDLKLKLQHLCGACLTLINTLDHLQLQLEVTKSELLSKFRKTYLLHNRVTKKIKFKRFCDLHSFKCKLCKKGFTPKQLLRMHLKTHKLHNLLCELCGRRFKSKTSLKLHASSHKKTIDAFTCSLCEKTFRTKSNLNDHYNYCSDKYPYTCCNKKFATISKLKCHNKLKHDKKFVAICSICNVGFIKISDYKSHKITHSTEKKYNCTQCDKCYKTLGNLNFHMKVHQEKLPFICTICEKGFMRKEYLEAHLNNHNGIKNYACRICTKKFVSQKNLDAHLKYHDGTIKERTCNVCNKMITSSFEEHLRSHSNLKEFQCDVCVMRFNTKGALAKHKKRKHS